MTLAHLCIISRCITIKERDLHNSFQEDGMVEYTYIDQNTVKLPGVFVSVPNFKESWNAEVIAWTNGACLSMFLLVPLHYMNYPTWLKIKTHGRVSAAKKDVRHTSVLFAGTAKALFSTSHISITTRPISIKLTYFMLSIYATRHTKLKEIG